MPDPRTAGPRVATFLMNVRAKLRIIVVTAGLLALAIVPRHARGPESFSEPIRGAKNPVNSIYFVDSPHEWISFLNGNRPTLLRTSDGGGTWARVPSPETFYKFFFTSLNHDCGLQITSGDDPGSAHPFLEVKFWSLNEGCAVGGSVLLSAQRTAD
jgi:hypothetical protein